MLLLDALVVGSRRGEGSRKQIFTLSLTPVYCRWCCTVSGLVTAAGA